MIHVHYRSMRPEFSWLNMAIGGNAIFEETILALTREKHIVNSKRIIVQPKL